MKKLVILLVFSFATGVSQARWFDIPFTKNGYYKGPDGEAIWSGGCGTYRGNDGSYEIWAHHYWSYDGPEGHYEGTY
jgi:hypothetical protein